MCAQATCLRSSTPVVLKVYYRSRVPDNVMHMVLRERAIHASQDHRNVVRLYAAFQVSAWAGGHDMMHAAMHGVARRGATPPPSTHPAIIACSAVQ